MEITKTNLLIEEFLQIYPKVSLNIEHNENDQLIKFFNIINRIKRKKSSIILDINQIQKLMKNQKKPQISSLNFENNEILSIQKIKKIINNNENNKNEKVLYRISKEEEDVEKYVDKLNEDFFLINKAIEQQKRNLKRTKDIKRALVLFLGKSELIKKIAKNYGINNSINPLEDKNIDKKIRDRMKTIISNLANDVIIKKYEKNNFIIRKNEIGKDCYFLLSGRLSILKPVEYKYIKITYEDYLKYLVNLKYNKEEKIFEIVTNINWQFMKVYNEENLMEIIKYYIQKRISVYSNISYDIYNKKIKENLTLENIELFLLEFYLKFEDFGLSKEKIISDLKKIKHNENSDEFQMLTNDYFKNIFKIDKKTQLLLNSYDFLFEKEEFEKNKLVTLYKYENFFTLSPGAFFGEMSLNSENKKRNASIRTETESIVASLSIEKYANYLMDEDKKILMRQINFLCYNFFFNNISQKIFSKYYFSMFKLINYNKDNIIYEQGNNCDSIYFIRNGTIKYEINGSVGEIHNLIYFLIAGLKKSKSFKLNNNFVNDLKSKYLKNHDLIKMRNANIILLEKLNITQKFELNTSETYEVLGLPEYFFDLPYFCTCTIISTNARLFELGKNSLNNIISFEKAIKEDLYKLIIDKIIIFIRRLFNIEDNFIKSINSKISNEFFKIYDTKFYNYINFERNNLFNGNKTISKNYKEEEKNKKVINEKEDLLLIKKYSKIGYVDAKIIKNKFYSPIKFNKKIINPKILSEMKNLNTSREYPIINLKNIYENNKTNYENSLNLKPNKINTDNNLSNRKDNNFIIQSKEIIQKENNINIKEPQNLIIKNQIKNEKINDSIRNSILNNGKKISDLTLINIGKSYISLPKLRKLIISSGKPKEHNLSIVKNGYENMSQISESQRNMGLNEDDAIINDQNNKMSLPHIKRQNSCLSFPLKRRIQRKINKSNEHKENRSEMSIQNNRGKNILAKYIKNYYQRQKIKGYSAILNPKFNTYIKKKANKSL